MDFPPSGKKFFLAITDQLNDPTQIVCLHSLGPYKRGNTIRSDQIDLGMSFAKHMHMGWLVIVGEYNDAQAICPMDCDH
jgi:hypothetical protein